MQIEINKSDIVIVAIIRENDDEISPIKELKSYNNKVYTLNEIKKIINSGINVHVLSTKINQEGIVEMSVINGTQYF